MLDVQADSRGYSVSYYDMSTAIRMEAALIAR